jgi:hypothetical protein
VSAFGAVVDFKAEADATDLYAVTACNGTSGVLYGVGRHVVVCTISRFGLAGDACQIVLDVLDRAAPVYYLCPADVIVDSASGRATASWVEPVVYDVVDGDALAFTQSHASGVDTFASGTVTAVEYSATDATGNTAKCSFDVIVSFQQSQTLQCALVGVSSDYDANVGEGFLSSVTKALGVRSSTQVSQSGPTTQVPDQLVVVVSFSVDFVLSTERDNAEEAVNATSEFITAVGAYAKEDAFTAVNTGDILQCVFGEIALAPSSDGLSEGPSALLLVAQKDYCSSEPCEATEFCATVTGSYKCFSTPLPVYPRDTLTLDPAFVVFTQESEVRLSAIRASSIQSVYVENYKVAFTVEEGNSTAQSRRRRRVLLQNTDYEAYSVDEELEFIVFMPPSINMTAFATVTVIMDPLGVGGTETLVYESALYYVAEASDCLGVGEYVDLAGKCRNCPSGGTCLGGGVVVPKPGYWNEGVHSPVVECKVPSACLGGIGGAFSCADAYTDVACSECNQELPGYFRLGDLCKACGASDGEEVDRYLRILAALVTLASLIGVLSVASPKTMVVSKESVLALQQLAVIFEASTQHLPESLDWLANVLSYFGVINWWVHREFV